MLVGEYCTRDVVVINDDESVKTAAELMRKHHVGDLVILEEINYQLVPIGIITDRDLVIEVMAKGVAPESLLVKDLLVDKLIFTQETDTLFDALELMRETKVRRLPVVNAENKLIGIITLDDVLDIMAEMFSGVIGVIKLQQKKEATLRV